MLPLTITFGVVALFSNGVRASLLWVSTRVSFAVGSNLSNEIYRRTLYQPYDVHLARNSSEVINGISTKVGEVIFYILIPTLNLISAGAMLIAMLFVLLFIVPGIALVIFVGFGIAYLFLIGLARNKLKLYSEHIARESTNVIRFLQEGLGGIRDILIDGSQEFFCANYRDADQKLRRAQGGNQFVGISPRYGMEAMAMLFISTLAYVLAKQPGGVGVAIPMLAAIALCMQRLLPALQQVYGAWSTIHGAQISLQDALKLLDQPLPIHVGQSSSLQLPFQQYIELNKISFRFNPKARWVLKDVSLKIYKGARVGFIGSTGSGKSTLLDIIMGLLQPIEGTLAIDGQLIAPANCRSWQVHIAHVPQVIFIADSNIEENIAFGIPKDQIDRERVRQVSRQAQIADVIESWPEQYQTRVGERGVQLSGGQRQRIGIARALYKHVDVLIFDESTNALDSETELAVMRAIDTLSLDLTVLIIAHRLSTLKNCTQIFEIAHGTIQEKKFPLQ